MQRIILASQSPRRRQLLEWAEVPFMVVTANTEELIPPNTPVNEVPIVIAREKANVVISKINDYTGGEGQGEERYKMPVLAADTIVVLDDEIINKPVNRENAIEILSRLSGKKHKVITGVVILYQGHETSFADITEVEFHTLTTEQIEFYVDKYQPYDKAGAYAIQEWIGVIGIKCIRGDFYNVMGLPTSKVVQELQRLLP